MPGNAKSALGVGLLLAGLVFACVDVTPTPPLEGGLPGASGDAGDEGGEVGEAGSSEAAVAEAGSSDAGPSDATTGRGDP